MRLILEPLPDHPGCYVITYIPQSGSATPGQWNGFVDEVWQWLAERGVHADGNHRVVRLTDDQAFETRMRWS